MTYKVVKNGCTIGEYNKKDLINCNESIAKGTLLNLNQAVYCVLNVMIKNDDHIILEVE